jgi:hypothetical protein
VDLAVTCAKDVRVPKVVGALQVTFCSAASMTLLLGEQSAILYTRQHTTAQHITELLAAVYSLVSFIDLLSECSA